jgi:hypothetical protein
MVEPNADSIMARLGRDAFLYPPMEPFESPFPDAGKAMEAVIARCCKFSGTTTWHLDSLKKWLMRLFNRNDAAFYGSAVSDSSSPSRFSDIDLMFFPATDFLPLAGTPDYVHSFRPFEEVPYGRLPTRACIFLAGPLLFPDNPDVHTLRLIEAERRMISSLPFFNGGIGEILTYAAFKAVESGPLADECGKDFPASLKFRLERKWFDGTNMQMAVHTPHELNEQIREQIRQLKDPEVHALAMSAMRRVRVKESARAALAEKFVNELRRNARG